MPRAISPNPPFTKLNRTLEHEMNANHDENPSNFASRNGKAKSVGRGEKGSHFRGQWPPSAMTAAISRCPVNTSPELGTRTFNLQICGPLFAAKLAPNFAATDTWGDILQIIERKRPWRSQGRCACLLRRTVLATRMAGMVLSFSDS